MKVNQIIHGNSLEKLKEIPDHSIDLVVTSPPYFNLKKYGKNKSEEIDTGTIEGYLNDSKTVFKECFRTLKDGSFICVVVGQYTSKTSSYFIPGQVANLLEEIGFNYKREHIWVKPLGTQGIWNRGTTSFLKSPYPRNTMINIHHEHILIFQKGNKPTIFEGHNPLSEKEVKEYCWSIWQLKVSKTKEHPAPFPESIPERLIKMYSYEDEVVLDPFIGTGTVAEVALKLNRNFIGIELFKKYVDLANQKIKFLRQELPPNTP